MKPQRGTGPTTSSARTAHTLNSPPWTTTSAPGATSPSVESDNTSDDAGDLFDADDALDFVSRRSGGDSGSLLLPPTVEHAISAVYEEITREEKAAGGADLWGLRMDDDENDRRYGEPNSSNRSDDAHPQRPFTDRSVAAKSSSSKEDASALKRARRSEIEKKSRQRRQGVLRRMRDDVHRLECMYADLLEKKASSGEIDALVKPSRRPRSTNDTKQLYARLSVLAQTLTDEHSHIQRLLHEHELFQQAIAGSGICDPPVADHGIPISASFDAPFERLSVEDCYAIVRESHEAICRFEDSGDFVSTGASFMGWTDRRKFDEVTSALQYGFQKKYPHESAELLLLKTWDIFRDEEKMAKLSFDSSVKMKFEVLQVVNDDLYIIRRDHLHPGMSLTFLTVYILFRLHTSEGFTLCFRTIPAPEIQKALEPHEIFFDVFHWTHFNHIRDENGVPVGCEVVTGGSIGDPTMLVARHWLFELIISVLRWESSCVTPLFIKI